MAGYPDWMNPNPQTAHMDRLLNNPAAGILPERMQTRERVEPPWQVPWQGNADFVTDIPGNAGVDPLRRGRESLNQEYIGAINPALGGTFGNPGLVSQFDEPVPQTQRPAKPTKEFPWGQSIADSFMGGLRKMDESSFWREDGSPSDAWQQLKNALTGPRDPEVGRQFDRGPTTLPSFPVF